MIIKRNVHRPAWLLLVLLGCLGNLTAADTGPAEMKFKAILIWATDGEKPANKPKLKQLDEKMREKLKVFRWKNYFEVDQENFSVKRSKSNITCMSRKCVIEVKHLGYENFEVMLYGEGKLVCTHRQHLPRTEYLFLAGDAKEARNDAWLVALTWTSD
jgi:hypothetical protein